jgi:hypothetical protein
MDNAGGIAKLVGAAYVVGDVKVNTFYIYYNSSIASAVQTGGTGQVSRVSWDEIVTSW